MRSFSAISRFEAAALLGGVGEFAEAVGEFDAADIKLEALGNARIARRPRQRRLHGRIFVENGGAADAEIALDALHQHAAENIAPAIVVGDADAGRLRGAGKLSRSGSPSGSVANRSMPAKRAKASATVSRSGSAKGSAERPRKLNCRVPAACGRQLQDRRAIVHQRPIGLAGAIPFDQREFRMMQRAALAIAEHFGEFDDAPLAGREQLLAGEFRRRAQIKRRRASRPGAASVVAKACRWVSLPGETCSAPVSTSTKSCAANHARSAATMRPRANRAGRRSAWTCGAQKGEERGGSVRHILVQGQMRK